MKPLVIGLALWVLAGAACAQDVQGRHYQPGPFDRISLNGSAVVRFVQGDHDEVFVEGGEAIQRDVVVQLVDGQLQLRTRGAWKFWRPADRIRLQITARELHQLVMAGGLQFLATEPVHLTQLKVELSGGAVARFDQLKAAELQLSVSGSGDGRLAGSAERLMLLVSGRSDMQAGQLRVQQASVSISGLGKSQLWVQKELSVDIFGIASVDYWGSPTLSRNTRGLGNLKALGDKVAGP